MRKKDKKRGKKKENIFRESWNYLKESRNYVYLAIALFVLGAIVGFAFPDFFGEYFNQIIKDLIEKTKDLNTGEMVFFIFQNNVLSSLMAVVLGFVLGVFPVASIVINGILLGYVMNKVIAVEGVLIIWRLVPHGIFELPAIFISVGLGIKFGMFLFVKKGKKSEEFRRRLWKSLKVFLTIVLPLLIIAAIIEGVLIGFGQ